MTAAAEAKSSQEYRDNGDGNDGTHNRKNGIIDTASSELNIEVVARTARSASSYSTQDTEPGTCDNPKQDQKTRKSSVSRGQSKNQGESKRTLETKTETKKSLRPKNTAGSGSKTASKRSQDKSPFFSLPKPRKDISCIPFPPLDQDGFGLAQERLSHQPFRLLVACIFLNKTRGAVAMPVFYRLMQDYPSPEDLAGAKHEEIVTYFQHLGLQNQRAKKVKALAAMWCCRPPTQGQRYRCLHYPCRGDGRDLSKDECIDDDDDRVAWEVAHLPGVGAYAYDSWRIFCRDELRHVPKTTSDLDREWTRVLPLDKELRAYLRWRWLKLGWVWNPVTGQRRQAQSGELADAQCGGVIIETDEGDKVVRAGSSANAGTDAEV